MKFLKLGVLTKNIVYNTTCEQRATIKVQKERTFEASFALLYRSLDDTKNKEGLK